MTRPGIGLYLGGAAALAVETGRDLRLLPLFVRLVAMIPATVARWIGD